MIYNDRLAIDNTNPALKKTFVSVLFYGEPDTRFVASGTIVYTSSTNQQYILSAPTNTHTPIPAPIAIELAFKKIGVPTDVYVSTNTAFVTKPGDWGILVKPKY